MTFDPFEARKRYPSIALTPLAEVVESQDAPVQAVDPGPG